MRYLHWIYDPDPSDTTCVAEHVYLLREDGRPTRVVHDPHLHGLFPRQTWLSLLRESAFDAKIVRDDYQRDVLVAKAV